MCSQVATRSGAAATTCAMASLLCAGTGSSHQVGLYGTILLEFHRRSSPIMALEAMLTAVWRVVRQHLLSCVASVDNPVCAVDTSRCRAA